MKDMNDSIAKVRGAVRYVRQSPSRLLKFKECVEMEKIQSKALLRLDVSTRWNSTYLMLDSAQKFERAFERFEEVDPNYRHDLLFGDGVPIHEDWESVRRLSMFLQQFYDLTVKISGSLYITANVYLDEVCDVYSTLRSWLQGSDCEFSSMAKRMVEKYDKYWGNVEKMNMLLYIACVLDPRYKYTYVDFCFKKMYPVDQLKDQASILSTKVRNAMVELFEEYKKMHQPQSSQSTQRESTGLSNASSLTDDISQRKGKEKKNKSDFKKYKVEIGCGEQKSELDRYLNEELDNDEDDDDFDILAWWKKNSHRFPILSTMARDILAMPISTVASESTFSTGGRVLDTYRSSLTPKIVQALICTQDWIRQGAREDDMENEIAEMDKFDLDLSKVSLDGVIDS
nr:zinc finger BED domain-containing protein RICESLEEPER 2-like [Ipomoea batatas]